MRTPLACLALLCVVGAAPAPAAGQESAVTMQLDSAVALAKAAGYQQSGDRYLGALDQGESEVLEPGLRSGLEYMIVGVCDYDCSDLDLVLADASGNELDSDLLEDDAPVVGGQVPQDGTYRLTVSMPSCSVEPCNYGVAVFARGP